jgi:hypothetical protein
MPIDCYNCFDINGGAIDGTTIEVSTASTGKFTTLNATSTVTIGAGGNEFTITESSDDIVMAVGVSDKDLTITGNDGGSTINALAFDMSDAGKATFNCDVVVGI